MLNDFKCSIIDMGNDVYQEVGRSTPLEFS